MEKISSYFENFRPAQCGKNSYLISFEGIEGCGKSTQIERFKKYLEDHCYQVFQFREPGGSVLGEKIREVLLSYQEGEIDPLAQAHLFMAARTQLLRYRVLPLLQDENTVVILDRYLDSTLAYQGGAGKLSLKQLCTLHGQEPLNKLPQLTFYLRVDYQTSQQRQEQRAQTKDYFEKQDKQYYQRLIDCYDLLANTFPARIKGVQASQSIDLVEKEIQKIWEQYRS